MLTMEAPRIKGLWFADQAVQYGMTLLITYLTGVWNLSLTNASAIVNFFSSTVAILPVGTQILVNTCISDYWMLLLSNLAYNAGCALLTISTPSVLASITDTCSADESQCIGVVQKTLLYISLPLIAMGVSGYAVSLDKMVEAQAPKCRGPLDEASARLLFQMMHPDQDPEPRLKARKQKPKKPKKEESSPGLLIAVIVVVVLPCFAGAVAVDYIDLWWIKFVILAVLTVVSTLFYFSGLCSYKRGEDDEMLLSWAEYRSMLRMIPKSMSVIAISILSSLANTYFMETASTLNPKVWSVKVTVLVLPATYSAAKLASKEVSKRFMTFTADVDYVIAFLVSMALAVLCCITAALVEARRLGVVRSHDMIDKPDDQALPMTMFWLVPQYLLLAGAEGWFEPTLVRSFTFGALGMSPDGYESFVVEKEVDRRYHCVELFVNAVSGVGLMSTSLLVYVAGLVKPAWFQHTLNKSRLDNLYWTLAALAAVNLVVNFIVFCVYAARKALEDDPELAEDSCLRSLCGVA